jgi:hypothetical protein
MTKEIMELQDKTDAVIVRNSSEEEVMEAKGTYVFKCFDKDGKLKWEDVIDNLVTTLGKNALLDAALAGSSYTVVGPFMGLISSVSYTTGPAAGDTMGSHGGWYEVAASTYFPEIAARITTNGGWNSAAAGAKALTSALSFSIINTGGTVKGAFLVFGAGAVATLGSTAGTLLSAGTFSGGDKVLSVGDTLQVSYSMSL